MKYITKILQCMVGVVCVCVCACSKMCDHMYVYVCVQVLMQVCMCLSACVQSLTDDTEYILQLLPILSVFLSLKICFIFMYTSLFVSMRVCACHVQIPEARRWIWMSWKWNCRWF